MLVGGVKRLRPNDGQLSLVCSDRNITKIFEITGLDRVFTIHATREEAIAPGRPDGARRLGEAARARGACAVLSRPSPRGLRHRRARRRAATRRGQGALQGDEVRRAATRSPTPARRARSGRTSTTRSRVAHGGLDEATIRAVVLDQIAIRSWTPNTGSPGMPANLVDGRGRRRGRGLRRLGRRATRGGDHRGGGGSTTGGGGRAAQPDGEALFTEADCGGCHTLAAAGTSGNVGPNLDDAKPSKELVIDRVTNGKGAMPSFKDKYSPEQIEAVAEYVFEHRQVAGLG